MTSGILNVHNIERTRMSFSVHDGSHTTSVATSSDHAQVSSLEFDGIHDFASVDVQLVRQNNLIRSSLEKIQLPKIALKKDQFLPAKSALKKVKYLLR